jgi:hypothetical protein
MRKKCFLDVLSGKLHSEKGTAAIITLSVILVLTALGTVSLLASAMNVRMSGRIISWSEDYYTLDTKAEGYVHKIDEMVLIPAEEDARHYVMNRLDRAKPEDLDGLFHDDSLTPPGDPYQMYISYAQDYFNKYYLETWTYEAGGDRHEYTVHDYEQAIVDGTFNGKTIEEISRNYVKDGSPAEDRAARAYTGDLLQYTEELFDRVYFHMVAKRLEYLHMHDDDFSDAKANIVIKSIAYDENYGRRENTEQNRCTYRFSNIRDESPTRTISETWERIKPESGDITIYIRAWDPTNIRDKLVHVAVEVIRPAYETIEKTIYTPVYGNPIWANALTVRGGIKIGEEAPAKAVIKGDVYASGASGEPYESGLTVFNNTTVDIYGNVYTAGNVQAVSIREGNGGTLRVHTSETGSSGVSYNYKKAIYGNEYLHENHYAYDIDIEYTADQDAGSGSIPFVFKDSVDQGNVYCESLEVAEGVESATLQVDGNLWTMDDIQMDGQRSLIRVGTTETSGGEVRARYSYIGLNPFSDENDPNKSSSVINNFPFFGDGTPNSSIILNSNFLVPGVAFYHFYDSDGNNKFYKSIESATARTMNPTSIINAYVDTAGAGGYFNLEGDEFRLIPEENDPQRNALTQFVYDIDGVYTNVRSNLTNPAGYVAGVALIEKASGAKATVYTHNPGMDTPGAVSLDGSNNNQIAFSKVTFENKIFRLHTAKTKMLGKYVGTYDPDAAPIDFGDLVHRDMLLSMGLSDIVRIPSGGTLNINPGSGGVTSGIVYCAGDMTIRGDGTEFKGAIICEGDVTIEGDVRITYDEDVIRRKLRYSEKLRTFFSKGEMGDKLFDIHEYSTTSGERVNVKRYRIAAWKEIPANLMP